MLTNLQKYFSKPTLPAEKKVKAKISIFVRPAKKREKNEDVICVGGKWLCFVRERKLHYNLQQI